MLDVVFSGSGLAFFAATIGNMEGKEMRFGTALMAGR
jgi:K+-transporting ATPase A subunit